LAAQAIAAIPTISKIVDKVLDLLSKKEKLGKDEVKTVRGQLDETKKNIESVRSGLYQAGKQILDYEDLYSASIRANAICEQLLNLLSGYATGKKKGELSDEVGECLSKLYASLDGSLGTLKNCVKRKDLTDDDYDKLSKTMEELTEEKAEVKSALKDNEYGTARDSLQKIDNRLKGVNKDVRDSVYDIPQLAVKKLEK
jgi:septation ring formation regulator EzrA